MKRQRLTADRFERLASDRPGEDVLRRRIRTHQPLRLRPRLPAVVNFGKVLFTETPLLISLGIVAFLTASVATAIFFLERETNDNVNDFRGRPVVGHLHNADPRQWLETRHILG